MAKTTITDITNQDFRKLLKEFLKPPYVSYKSKQVYNELTKAYLCLIKQVSKLIKSKNHIWMYTERDRSYAKKIIDHINKTIQFGNISMNRKELETINLTSMYKK